MVVLSYFYLDRFVADFSHNYFIYYEKYFNWMTYIPAVLTYISPITIIILAIKSHLNKTQKMFFSMSLALLLATALKDELKVIFGRLWPATWINNNLSWLHDRAYGFNFFHGNNAAYQSFPSGHTAAIFAVMSVLWIVYPKYRWLSVLTCTMVISGLIVMDYHFVGDIIAGAFLGTICGVLSHWCLTPWAKERAPLA